MPQRQNGLCLDSIDTGETYPVNLENTCAIDSLLQILAVSYADSDQYRMWLEVRSYVPALALVKSLMNDGIGDNFYNLRASFLCKRFSSVVSM